jgi:hypothetical protein
VGGGTSEKGTWYWRVQAGVNDVSDTSRTASNHGDDCSYWPIPYQQNAPLTSAEPACPPPALPTP